MSKIRVLLANDHQAVRERVSGLLGEDFEVVGTADNGREAVVATQRLDPDVLVIDISMRVLDGLQATQQLRATHPRTKVVFLTVHKHQDFVAAALSAGASGYVAKADVATDLVAAIRDAIEGRVYISKSITL